MSTKMSYFLSDMDPKNEDSDMVHDIIEEYTLKYHISKDQLFFCTQIFLQIYLNNDHLQALNYSYTHQSLPF
jgi:hypothetical protein